MSTDQVLDRVFTGEPCELVHRDGRTTAVQSGGWRGEATPADLALFVEKCRGSTLDVGCGPGRLTAALNDRGLRALGIDISDQAVQQTRARGAEAVRVSVFDDVPGAATWQHVLLADGNIGIGGDPVRLLRRVADLLAEGGSVVVEVAGTPGEVVHRQLRLRAGRDLSEPFDWATVGVDAIAHVADAAGLHMSGIRHAAGRSAAILRHRLPGQRFDEGPRWC